MVAMYRDTVAVNVTVPGEVHQQLFEAGILKHSKLYRKTSGDDSWVTMQKHRYQTMFHVDTVAESMVIKMDKVGTIANVYVNDNFVGYLDNIYRTYYLKVPMKFLKLGDNVLIVDIESTVK